MKCEDCDDPVTPTKPGIYTLVLGWDTPRPDGGTNHILLRDPQGKFLCSACMARRKGGVSPGQATLG